jgi:SH3-like domain-containing protein
LAAGAALTLLGACAQAETVACDVQLNITDQDPAGLNVRAAPAGAVITSLKARNRWVQVDVTGVDGAWARIEKATFISEDNAGGTVIFHRLGWVAFSKLGIEELNPQSTIFAAPRDDAQVLLRINEGDEAKIPAAEVLGCEGTWLKVRVSGKVGWTQNFCSNQFTTCV